MFSTESRSGALAEATRAAPGESPGPVPGHGPRRSGDRSPAPNRELRCGFEQLNRIRYPISCVLDRRRSRWSVRSKSASEVGRRGRRPNPADRRSRRARRRAARGLVQQAARPLQGDGPTSNCCRPACPSWSAPATSKSPGPTVPRWPGGATRTTGPHSSARSPRPGSLGTRSSCAACATTRCGPDAGGSPSGSRTWTSTGSRRSCAFQLPAVCGQQFLGARTGSWRSSASRPTTTGWWRNGAAKAVVA